MNTLTQTLILKQSASWYKKTQKRHFIPLYLPKTSTWTHTATCMLTYTHMLTHTHTHTHACTHKTQAHACTHTHTHTHTHTCMHAHKHCTLKPQRQYFSIQKGCKDQIVSCTHFHTKAEPCHSHSRKSGCMHSPHNPIVQHRRWSAIPGNRGRGRAVKQHALLLHTLRQGRVALK